MTYHIRVRPTALVLRDESVLLVEYVDENGLHYNLPGGGAEPGESIVEGALRELREETTLEAQVGPVAFVYEYAPHKQSRDNLSGIHTLYIVFECYPLEGSFPKLPAAPDPNQTDVKWIPLEQLDDIILYPNIKKHIRQYAMDRRNIEMIEDFVLDKYS
ncbi:NUDIX domain-containing protein [Paenibacillus sp. FSL H8-0457]|uniref:NUDIX domain-containing protein n=1 Tax=unclassified Paenibacillus TaxID=185978 RepID=UPI0001B9EDCB|nr:MULTISPECIES: NUDIX domain-containing protein [unclassified Paenibacillus]ACX66611.1 NUDIX hydrolase [Paenibacillus sp. Y412MC10]